MLPSLLLRGVPPRAAVFLRGVPPRAAVFLRGVPPRAAVFLRGVPPRAPRLKAPSTRTRKKSCAIIAALDEISGPGVDLNVIETTAPGKQVLTGEYAVLAGAPALAAAVDRQVMCRMTPANKGDWSFVSHGFEARATHRRDDLPDTGPAALARFALTSLDIDPRTLPAHLQIQIDSRPNSIKVEKNWASGPARLAQWRSPRRWPNSPAPL